MAGINELGKLTGLKGQQVADVFDAILNLTRSGQRVTIRGFGSFWEVSRRGWTIVSSAIKGGKAEVPETKVLRFRASKDTRRPMKARVQGRSGEEK